MDYGNYNCRDYHITPHFSPMTITTERSPLYRHESFDELEERSRSPASQKPKFPLLQLPLELRQQILSYLLPHTQEYRDSGLLSQHARNFSAVKKREARGMFVPNGNGINSVNVSNVVWQRGNINVVCACKQLHEESTELIYGTNTFMIFVTYSGIRWRFRWLLPSGLAPSRNFDLLKLMPERYLRLIKRVIVHVDHVDSYTGMIKHNVSGKGLTYGLQRQVQLLVNALRETRDGDDERRLAKVNIRVSNGNAVIDSLKSDEVKQQEGRMKVVEDLEEMLEPFEDLCSVREVTITGAIGDEFAWRLAAKMRSEASTKDRKARKIIDEGLLMNDNEPIRLCVYGNDMS